MNIMTKNGRNKFGGSKNPNRTKDSKNERSVNAGELADNGIFKPAREKEDKPRAPPRPATTPYNGKRASNIATAEYKQICRVLEGARGRFDKEDVIQWYKILFSDARRANIDFLTHQQEGYDNNAPRTRGVSWQNMRGQCPVVSDEAILANLYAARDAGFWMQSSPFYHVTRQVVANLRSIAKPVIVRTKRFSAWELLNIDDDEFVGQREVINYEPKLSRKARKLSRNPNHQAETIAERGSHGEVTEGDDFDGVVSQEPICQFPVPFSTPFSTGVSSENLYERIGISSIGGNRYVTHAYETDKAYCAGFISFPLTICDVCRHGVAVNIDNLEQSIRNLDDCFLDYIPCQSGCPPIVSETPECIMTKRGFSDLIQRAIALPQYSLNHSSSQLNGSHGEYTESDDVKKAGGGRTGGTLKKIAAIESRLASMMLSTRRRVGGKIKGKKKAAGGGRAGGGMGKSVNREKKSNIMANFGALAKLHPHTQRYMVALANPHSESAIGVGNVIRAKNSRKADARLTFTVQPDATMGIFIFFSMSVASDLTSVMVVKAPTTGAGTYDGTNITSSTYTRYGMTDLPYALGVIGPEGSGTNETFVTGLPCMLGIKLTSIGAALNRGGEAFWYESDNHASVVTAPGSSWNQITASITGKRTTRRVELARDQSHEFTVTPHTSAEHEFPTGTNISTFPHSYHYPWCQSGLKFSPTGSSTDGAPMAVLIIPEQANVSYRIEIKGHYEYIGNSTKSSATLTHSDPEIGRMIADNVMKVKQTHHLTPHASNVGSIFKSVMQELGSKALQGGVDMLKKEMANPELLSTASSMVGALLL